jgi:dihydrodipicolinate synthase/N-acetylneuraminate lyase
MPHASAAPYRGIIPPIITPLKDRDTLDVAGLEALLAHMLAGGVHGIFALGTTGEAPSLSYRLRREMVQRTCQLVAGKVPVLVGITDTSFVESVELARYSATQGAKAVVLSAPYYFPVGQPELIEYVEDLVPELPLPVFLYNMPSHTKVTFDLDTVKRAMQLPGVAGMKDSSGNMVYFHQLVRELPQRPDWSLLVGPEELLGESVLLGGHGGVSGGANLCPKLYVALYDAAVKNDVNRVAELHSQVMRISSTIYKVGRHGSAFIKSVKCALSVLGICDDFLAEPFHRFREQERERVGAYLREFGITRAQPWPLECRL